MKHTIKDFVRLSSITIMLLSLGAVGFSAIPDAFAMPGPMVAQSANIIVQDSTNSFTVTTNTFPPHTAGVIYVHDPNAPVNGLLWTAANTPCTWQFAGTDTGSVWELQDGNGALVTYTLDGTDPLDSITVTFGGNPNIVLGDSATLSLPPNPAYEWVDITANNAAPTTNTLTDASAIPPTFYGFHTCGTDNGSTQPVPYGDDRQFAVVLPVGGEVLQIDSAALMIAGLSTGMTWLAPVILAGVGAVYSVYRLRK